MGSYLKDFSDVKPKNSSEEALQRWRKACWLVKNRKRRFRFTANLSKRFKVREIQKSNQVKNIHLNNYLVQKRNIYFMNFLNFKMEWESILNRVQALEKLKQQLAEAEAELEA